MWDIFKAVLREIYSLKCLHQERSNAPNSGVRTEYTQGK